jgi:CxxC motif-containing protein (DUF1111 family)
VAALDATNLALFLDGQTDFATNDTPPELGPIYNGPVFNNSGPTDSATPAVLTTPSIPPTESCATCHGGPHNTPAGGSEGSVEERFGRTDSGLFDALTNEGGSLLQFFAVPGTTPEVLPTSNAFATQANTFALRRTTVLFGAGLIDAIPDAALLANAANEASQFPDQQGEVVMDTDPDVGVAHVGRFGWKCQHATLFSFAGDAYLNEMGVSNTLFPQELVPNQAPVDVALADVKDQPNPLTVQVPGQPNVTLTDIQRFTNFMRFLAVRPTTTPTAALQHGAAVFTSIGCATCHTPSFTTVSSIPALNNQNVQAYSDFLLHDVGTGDGIVQVNLTNATQGQETANELRTAPLIAVQGKGLMHDAASPTVQDAILRHQNQGATARQNFSALSTADQQAVVDFVNSL